MDEDSVVWDEAYSVGLPHIDEQHKKLVSMINDLFEVCKRENSSIKVAFARAFGNAVEYAQTHFQAEEEYLKQAGYPALPEHKKEHESFMTEIWKQFSKFKEDSAAAIGLPRFLKKWLLNHIAVKDKQYAAFLGGIVARRQQLRLLENRSNQRDNFLIGIKNPDASDP